MAIILMQWTDDQNGRRVPPKKYFEVDWSVKEILLSKPSMKSPLEWGSIVNELLSPHESSTECK